VTKTERKRARRAESAARRSRPEERDTWGPSHARRLSVEDNVRLYVPDLGGAARDELPPDNGGRVQPHARSNGRPMRTGTGFDSIRPRI